MKRLNGVLSALFALAVFLDFCPLAGYAQQPEPGQLNMQSLKTMIENLGYQPKELKNDKGIVVRYLVTVPVANANWKVSLEISPNQENLWIYGDLATVSDLNQVPREVLVDMLKANETIGPTYFAYNERARFFVLYQAVTNRGVNARVLRERIEMVAKQIGAQERLWNPNRWATGPGPGPGPVTISPEVQRLMNELASPDELVRLKAAKDLGKLGAAARPAIPALQKLLQDPDEDVRRVAASAIERIQGTPGPGPGPGPGPEPGTVAGTVWEGTESLSGFGKLMFRFESGGKAIMIDAVSTTEGKWTQSGNQVTVTFGNCVYTGAIQGQTLTGNARFTVGEPRPWTFSLTRTGNSIRSASGSKPEFSEPTLGGRNGR